MRAQSPHAIQQAAIRCSIAAHNVEAPHKAAQARHELLLMFRLSRARVAAKGPLRHFKQEVGPTSIWSRRAGPGQSSLDARLTLRKLPRLNAAVVLTEKSTSFTESLGHEANASRLMIGSQDDCWGMKQDPASLKAKMRNAPPIPKQA